MINKQMPSEEETGRMFTCDKCQKVFNYKKNLKRHKEQVHDGLTWPCTRCDKTFRPCCHPEETYGGARGQEVAGGSLPPATISLSSWEGGGSISMVLHPQSPTGGAFNGLRTDGASDMDAGYGMQPHGSETRGAEGGMQRDSTHR